MLWSVDDRLRERASTDEMLAAWRAWPGKDAMTPAQQAAARVAWEASWRASRPTPGGAR